MLSGQLPDDVAVVETTNDSDLTVLFPEERWLVAASSPARQREFATGRHCARRAFGLLGWPPMPVLRDGRRNPQWPSGLVGSITHCPGYCAAAVAQRTDYDAIGIDAEPNASLASRVLNSIASREEQDHLWALARAHPGVSWDRAIFSAKESVYKAWYQLDQRWHDFHDVTIRFDPGTQTYTSVARGWLWAPVTGSFSVQDGLILSSAVVRATEMAVELEV
ncbi:MAG TPA: 4'-phosphopantetheinyl transferase superfamily protein [Microlunatus sp.]|nr:4'-phosphopantetheinyl transferase superfamily protein [Microlunatus sp.]